MASISEARFSYRPFCDMKDFFSVLLMFYPKQLDGLTSLVVNNGTYVDVEWYQGSNPEKETILDSGTWSFSGLSGRYWIYIGCSNINDVMNVVQSHIDQRLTNGANNGGFASPQENASTFTKS